MLLSVVLRVKVNVCTNSEDENINISSISDAVVNHKCYEVIHMYVCVLHSKKIQSGSLDETIYIRMCTIFLICSNLHGLYARTNLIGQYKHQIKLVSTNLICQSINHIFLL